MGIRFLRIHVSYLYPMSVLNGKGARWSSPASHLPEQDRIWIPVPKVVHSAPETTSYINTKSISKDGGISTFRSSVVVQKNSAPKSKSAVSCQSLMLDSKSRSDTIPAMDIRTRTPMSDMRQDRQYQR